MSILERLMVPWQNIQQHSGYEVGKTMASYSPKLEGKKINWVKAHLAVLFTKEGLEPFVCDVIHQFQLKCLDDIWYNNGIFSGTLCSCCNTENVVRCPTRSICGSGQCRYHRNPVLTYMAAGCPKRICHNFKLGIQKAHRYHCPSYKNTDATKWCSNFWEVAKCFMPSDGYKDKVSATETDLIGMISVILNHKDFQGKIHENLEDDNNVFKEVRETVNELRHSSNLEVEDSDLQKLLELLQKLLSDSEYLANDKHAKHASEKLTKLQLENDTIVIGNDDIRKVLKDASTVLQDKMEAELDEQCDRIKQDMIKRKKEDLLSLDSQTAKGVTQLEDKFDAFVKRLHEERDKVIEKIHEQGVKNQADLVELGVTLQKALTASKSMKEEQNINSKQNKEQGGVEDLDKNIGKKRKSKTDSRTKREKKIKLLENYVDDRSGGDDNNGHDNNGNNNDNESIARVGVEIETTLNLADFKDQLKQWYMQYLVSLPLSVSNDAFDTDFETLYVKQELSERSTGMLESIKSLKDLFTPKRKVALEILLCSNVGAGNTTFAKYLTILWCRSLSPVTDSNDFYQGEDLKALCDIDFVFLLHLTHPSDKCETKDLIYEQIIQNLQCCSAFNGNKSLLEDILKTKRCLIILDDLDSWKHPCNMCTKPLKGIPHRYASDNIIVLTIARQRKFVQMNNSQIDKVIEINCLGTTSKEQLQINALKGIDEANYTIVNDNKLQSQQEEFQNEISLHNLDKLVSVPLILMHLVCLWCSDKLKKMSTSEVYESITEMLLSRTLKKYFQSANFTQQQGSGYKEILLGLGNLAFYSLKESKTITRSCVSTYLDEEHVKLCLMSGILSEKNGKIYSEENDPEICFTFENMREHFRQRLQKRE